jgi:hypothetical protein
MNKGLDGTTAPSEAGAPFLRKKNNTILAYKYMYNT